MGGRINRIRISILDRGLLISDDEGTPALRPPLQERSRRTLDRIVQAALDILAEDGIEGATVQSIVDRAGSSVGSFYARFDGKEALLDHLESRIWTDATERWREAVDEGRLEEGEPAAVVEGVVRLLLLTDRTHARQRRALAGRPGGSDDGGGAAAFLRTVGTDVRQALLDDSGAIRHRDPGAAVDFAFRALLGAIREMGEEAPGEAPELDDASLARELARMVTAYLGVDGPRDPEGVEQVEFFDVWG